MIFLFVSLFAGGFLVGRYTSKFKFERLLNEIKNKALRDIPDDTLKNELARRFRGNLVLVDMTTGKEEEL